MNTTEFTINLPREEIAFANEYAKSNGLTIQELFDRYLQRLQKSNDAALHPEVEKNQELFRIPLTGKKNFMSIRRQSINETHD